MIFDIIVTCGVIVALCITLKAIGNSKKLEDGNEIDLYDSREYIQSELDRFREQSKNEPFEYRRR